MTQATRWAYFGIEDGEKAIHVDLLTDELEYKQGENERDPNQKVVTWPKLISPCRSESGSSYLGHLDDVGKLCQTGDGDHIMIGFQLVPGEVIKHSKPHHGMQHFSEAM